MYKKIALLLVIAVSLWVTSRSVNRTESPTQIREWTVADSRAYAHDVVQSWADNQYLCLEKLWTKESNWRANAYNKVKVMGKNAGGIPQILGLDPATPPTKQIDRGLEYVYHRYDTPCQAWAHFQKRGWY